MARLDVSSGFTNPQERISSGSDDRDQLCTSWLSIDSLCPEMRENNHLRVEMT